MKKRNKRLLPALMGAMLLLALIPVISAFASDGQATVSGSDVSAQDENTAVSVTDAVPDDTSPEKMTDENVSVKPAVNNGQYDHCVEVSFNLPYYDDTGVPTQLISFNDGTQSVTCNVPNFTNPINTLLYWRDIRTGKIYYPGDTAVIYFSDMAYVREDRRNGDEDYQYYFQSVWQGDEFLRENVEWNLYYNIPLLDNAGNYDSFNFESFYMDSLIASGVYNARTDVTQWEETYFTVPSEIPRCGNYQFIEWNTAQDGSGKSYHSGDKIKVGGYDMLYAIFENLTERNLVQINPYDFIAEEQVGDYYLHYDESGIIPVFTVPEPATNPINTCIGWKNPVNKKVFEIGKTYYNVDMNEMAEPKRDDSCRMITLIPVWAGDELYASDFMCGVNYNGDEVINYQDYRLSGRYNVKTKKWKFDGNPSVTIPSGMVTDDLRNGYTFIGWNTSEFGVGQMYQTGDVLRFNEINDLFQSEYDEWIYPWFFLYATYTTDNDIEVVEKGGVKHYVEDVEPMEGLRIRNDVPVNNLKLVVSNLSDAVQIAVENAMNQTGVLSENTSYEAFDLSLVNSATNTNAVIESGKIKIFLQYPNVPNAQNLNYTLLHFTNGMEERVRYEKNADGLVFFADSFSPYVLMWSEPTEGGNESSSEGGNESSSEVSNESSSEVSNESGSEVSNEGGSEVSNEGGSQSDSPATGDGFHPGVWFVLMSVSMIAALGLLTWKKGLLTVLLENAE